MMTTSTNPCDSFVSLKMCKAYKFRTGVLDVPGEGLVRGTGLLPIVSFHDCPYEYKYTESEKYQLLIEVHNWLTGFSLNEEKYMKIGSDVVLNNVHGLLCAYAVQQSFKHTLLVAKFLTWLWIIDDLFDEAIAKSQPLKDTSNSSEAIVFHAMLMSVLKDPKNTKYDDSKFIESALNGIINAWTTIAQQIQELHKDHGNPIFFYESMDRYFLSLLVTSEVSRNTCTNEYMYRNARRELSAVYGLLELSALLCNISIEEVRQHQVFVPLIDAINDTVSWANDVLSLHKEYKLGEKFNLILVKMNQGNSISEAFSQTVQCIWDSQDAVLHYARVLLTDFPHNEDLKNYIKIGLNAMHGSLILHQRMQRYEGNTAEIVPFCNEYKDGEFRYPKSGLIKVARNFEIELKPE